MLRIPTAGCFHRSGTSAEIPYTRVRTTLMIYPENFESKIGFNEIRTMLKGRCLSALGIECVDKMEFLDDNDEIGERLSQISEMRAIMAD